ncbi:MAG: hypothetical protein V3S55_00020 [Nitrospiraceae bacterium]
MSATWANPFLVLAWVIFVVSAYRTPLVASQLMLPKVLWVVLFGSSLGLTLYYTLWTKAENALNLVATTSGAERPPGTTVAGIAWLPQFADLRIAVANNTNLDYQNLDFVFTPDSVVTAAAQFTNLPGVSIWRNEEPRVTPELFESGRRVAMPVVPIASTLGYRLRCDVLPAKSRIELVMAAVTMNDQPSSRPVDNLLVINFSDGTAFWLAHPNHTSDVFGLKPVPRLVRVSGRYIAGQRQYEVSEELKVSDYVLDGIRRIRQP